LDRGVADRARAAGDEHRPTGEGVGREPHRQTLGDRQAPVRGECRDAEARAEVDRGVVGQRHRLPRRQDHVLLGGPVGALPGGLPQPDPLTDLAVVDLGADRVDGTGAVLVGYRLRERQRPAAPDLPVRRVDPGHLYPDPHLARARLGDRPVDQAQDVGVAGLRVHDRLHAWKP
jgi:hypothetical protein